jgi:hypothetical protein
LVVRMSFALRGHLVRPVRRTRRIAWPGQGTPPSLTVSLLSRHPRERWVSGGGLPGIPHAWTQSPELPNQGDVGIAHRRPIRQAAAAVPQQR